MQSLLFGKVAVITGASHGLGLAIAEAFVSERAKVLLVGRRGSALSGVAKSLSAKDVRTLCVDVTHGDAGPKIIGATVKHFGRWDILVNSAGTFVWKEFLDLSEEDWDTTIATNLTAPFRLSQALAQHLRASAREGCVINIGSVHGVIGDARAVPQCASKFGVVGLTKAMAEASRASGMRVNCIAPGAMAADSANRLSQSSEARVTQADIAQLAVYLASDRARSITGVTIDAFGPSRPVLADVG